jgi:hypothetical protein
LADHKETMVCPTGFVNDMDWSGELWHGLRIEAMLAMLVSAIGVYGTVSYSVARARVSDSGHWAWWRAWRAHGYRRACWRRCYSACARPMA